MAEAAPSPPETKPKSAPQRAMDKLGLLRDIDLALHLPLRYEDETKLVPIASLRDGDLAQVEGVVTDSRVQFRPRRQLVVKIHDAWNDDPGDLVLRFLNFYPSTRRRWPRARAYGCAARPAAASSGWRWCTRASRRSNPARRWRGR